MVNKFLILFIIIVIILLCSCSGSEVSTTPIQINYEISPIINIFRKGKILGNNDYIYFLLKNNENFDIDLPDIHIDFYDKNGNIVASAGGETIFNNEKNHLIGYTFFRNNDITPFESKVYLSNSSDKNINWDTFKINFGDLSNISTIYYPNYYDYCEHRRSYAEYTKDTMYYPTRDFNIEIISLNRKDYGGYNFYEINAQITYLGEDISTSIEPVALIYTAKNELIGIEGCYYYPNLGFSLKHGESKEFVCSFDDFGKGNVNDLNKLQISWSVQGLTPCHYDFSKQDNLTISIIRKIFGDEKGDEIKNKLIENSKNKPSILFNIFCFVISFALCIFLFVVLEKIFSIFNKIKDNNTLSAIYFFLFLFLLFYFDNIIRSLFYINSG